MMARFTQTSFSLDQIQPPHSQSFVRGANYIRNGRITAELAVLTTFEVECSTNEVIKGLHPAQSVFILCHVASRFPLRFFAGKAILVLTLVRDPSSAASLEDF